MAWIDLDDVKAHLNKSGTVTTDDVELGGFIASACAQIEEIKGHVDLVTLAEIHPSNCRGYVTLGERPVHDVVSVARVLGDGTTEDVPVADPVAGVLGYTLLGGRSIALPSDGTYQVTYRAGLDPVPGNFRHAALDLVQHHWRKSQLNANAGRRPRINVQSGDTEGVLIPGSASALPYSVRELLGLHGSQTRDEVLFA